MHFQNPPLAVRPPALAPPYLNLEVLGDYGLDGTNAPEQEREGEGKGPVKMLEFSPRSVATVVRSPQPQRRLHLFCSENKKRARESTHIKVSCVGR